MEQAGRPATIQDQPLSFGLLRTLRTRVLYQVTATAAGAAPTKAAARRYYMLVTMATLDCILLYGRCNGNSSLIRLRQHHSRILFKLAGPRAS